MRKAVRQSVYGRCGRQADPEETATDFWIAHYARNLIQGFQRHFGVRVQKPENIAACCIGSKVHLLRTTARAASYNLIAAAFRQPIGAVSAPAIDNNNFRSTGSLAQIRQKRAYQWRLIKDRNDNGDLHRRFWLNFFLRDNAPKTFLKIKCLLDASLRRIEFNKPETHMIAKIITAAAITLFFTPAPALFSQEHPEHPTSRWRQKTG